MEKPGSPGSIAFQYSSYNLEEPTRKSEEYYTEPKISSNTYISNSEVNNLNTRANSINIPERGPTRKSRLLNKSLNDDRYQKPYKSFTDTNDYQEFDTEENDDETKDCPLDGGEIEFDVETYDEYNYANRYSFSSSNDWHPETDKYMSFGDYISKNYDKAEHVYAHLGNSLDDAEYYFIKKSDEDFAQKSSMFFGNSQYEPHYQNMMGDQAMFEDKFTYNDNVNYPSKEFMNDCILKKERQASGSFQSFRPPIPEKLSKHSHLNTKSTNAKKDNVYKEVLDKINETMSELKCAGVEDNTNPFLSSSENLNKIQRHRERKRIGIQTNKPNEVYRRVGFQEPFATEVQRKQERMNYSFLDTKNKFGKGLNFDMKLDTNSDPQLPSRPQKLNPSK